MSRRTAVVISLLGTLWAARSYVLAKGRSPHWAWLALLSFLGWFILLMLEEGSALNARVGAQALAQPADAESPSSRASRCARRRFARRRTWRRASPPGSVSTDASGSGRSNRRASSTTTGARTA